VGGEDRKPAQTDRLVARPLKSRDAGCPMRL